MTKQARKQVKTASPLEFLRVSETARILQVNRNTIYRLIESGEIPAVRVGRVYRIPASWLQAAGTKAP